ncbi:MAG: DNA cytosine methyltransferase [Maritimibacter sp.]|nr:DNA cytosine methyltransferase [Maritimibacter sp.]
MEKLTSIEFCAGAGGQALGLEQAGFDHKLLVDNDLHCTKTLRVNRPSWNVRLEDMQESDASDYRGVDLFAAGLPCPPFSVAGKQLGEADERNLFNDALRLIEQTDPKMVLIENVRGFLDPVFAGYREFLEAQFKRLGYEMKVELLNASDYGVSQLRPRVAIVAGKPAYWEEFVFPLHDEDFRKAPPVGELLLDLMAEGGWEGAAAWSEKANQIAPTIVGGSKKHGGPDLGPTRARNAWLKLGVNGKSIGDAPPEPGFDGVPRLTTRMVARVQGFPDDWHFYGKKTNAYRQVGNAFPPPVAAALGRRLHAAIRVAGEKMSKKKAYAVR